MDKDWQGLLKSYPQEKRSWDKTYPWIYYCARPLSFPISWVLLKARVSANLVTIFTALLGIGSVVLMMSAKTDLMVGGALCLFLYTIFDCVDGNLARFRPSSGSPAGQYWGELVGNFYLLAYCALGIGLRQTSWVALGAAVSIEKLLAQRIRDNFWSTLGTLWQRAKEGSGFLPHTGRWYYRLYCNLVDPQAHIALLPFLILAGYTKVFLGISALISLGELIIVLTLYLSRAHRIGSRSSQR